MKYRKNTQIRTKIKERVYLSIKNIVQYLNNHHAAEVNYRMILYMSKNLLT